jgi:site-specific recombinase XerD
MKTTVRRIRQSRDALARAVADFINHKRSLGLKYIIEENTLRRFSLLGRNYALQDNHVPSELIAEWFKRRPSEKANTFYSRCSCVKRFLQFAAHSGYYSKIPEISMPTNAQYVPYIFSRAEMALFFNACDTLPRYAGTFRHVIIPVVFRLLYSCGLRVSEAIGLERKDVDLHAGVLTIREPKNRQDRYVPMSPSMTAIMRKFSLMELSSGAENAGRFFVGKYNDHLSRHQVYHWFRLCLANAGIAHRGKGLGPREHDLRHTFCVHSLQLFCSRGVDPYCFLPWLSAYVGHKSIQATQQYLRLTAEAYPELTKTVAAYCGHVIPASIEEARYEAN